MFTLRADCLHNLCFSVSVSLSVWTPSLFPYTLYPFLSLSFCMAPWGILFPYKGRACSNTHKVKKNADFNRTTQNMCKYSGYTPFPSNRLTGKRTMNKKRKSPTYPVSIIGAGEVALLVLWFNHIVNDSTSFVCKICFRWNWQVGSRCRLKESQPEGNRTWLYSLPANILRERQLDFLLSSLHLWLRQTSDFNQTMQNMRKLSVKTSFSGKL